MKVVSSEIELCSGRCIKPVKETFIINLINSIKDGINQYEQLYTYFGDYDSNPERLLQAVHFYEGILFIMAEMGYLSSVTMFFTINVKPLIKRMIEIKKILADDVFNAMELEQYIYVPLIRNLKLLPDDIPIVRLKIDLCVKTYMMLFYFVC